MAAVAVCLNISVPDDLAAQVRDIGLSPSEICQRALAEAVEQTQNGGMYAALLRLRLDAEEAVRLATDRP